MALTTKSQRIRIRVEASGSVSAGACKDGEVVSGGFSIPDFSWTTNKLLLLGFNPTQGAVSGSSWRATATNLGTTRGGVGHLSVEAYCAHRHRRLFRRTETTKIAGLHTGGATARCLRGSEAVSGGFSMLPRPGQPPYYPYVQLFGYESRRVGHRGWHASAVNMKDRGRERFMVLVKCDPRKPGLRGHSKEVDVPAGGTASVEPRCRSKAFSGGFEGAVQPSGAGSFPLALLRTGKHTWAVSAFGEDATSQVTGYVYCDGGRRR